MKLVLATNHLGLGGSETYLLTVAEQLDRLGHQVVLYARERARGAEAARARAIDLRDESALPETCDALLVQDASVSYELAGRYPDSPQVFVAHSEYHDLQLPPQLEGVVSTVVALNERVARRVRALAAGLEVVRLHQPIDTKRFVPPAPPLPERPRRALVLSNYLDAPRFAALEDACAEAGIELSRTGGSAGQVVDPRSAIAAADVVIGNGRSVLEAMACARAAFVYDRWGGDGWVTASSYEELEADGFAGGGRPDVITGERLREQLREFDPAMGTTNRDLVLSRHRANQHAQQLVEVLASAAARSTPPAPLDEMARLVRLEWRWNKEMKRVARDNARLRERVAKLKTDLAERERDLRRARRDAERIESDYESALSWRVTGPLRAAGRLLRLGRRPKPAAESKASAEAGSG